MKTDTTSYPWTDILPPAVMNGKTAGKDHESGISDSDSKAETILIDSNSTDASKSTKKRRKLIPTSLKKMMLQMHICVQLVNIPMLPGLNSKPIAKSCTG